MRKFLGLCTLLLAVLAVGAWATASVAFAPPIYDVAGGNYVAGKKPVIEITWSDTVSGTVVRTDVFRRATTGSDTIWKRVGYTNAGYKAFTDPNVFFGRTYRYKLRDSTSGAALTAFSDSLEIAVIQR